MSGLTDSSLDDNGNVVIEDLPDAAVDFPATFPGTQCSNLGVCLVTDATITQDGETSNYVGRFVGRQGFFAYHVAQGEIGEQGGLAIDQGHPEPILAFGGTAHNFGTPSGKVYLFDLTPDVVANSPAPFSSAGSMPVQGFVPGETSVSPLALLTKDSNPESRDVWLQTSLYIGGTSGEDGYDQQSFVNIALGGIDSETGGLIGARRGGAHVDIDPGYSLYPNEGCEECNNLVAVDSYPYDGPTRESLAFTGDIASRASPDEDHFLGTDDPNFVIGFDTTEGGTQNIGRDIPLDPSSTPVQDQSGSTYHVGVGFDSFQPAEQQDGTFQGYAVGMVELVSLSDPNVVASKSAGDFTIGFNKTANTLWANLTVFDVQHTDPATGSYELDFGDVETFENRSAYIDDQHYAAIESGAQVSKGDGAQVTQYDYTSATSYLVSGDQLGVTNFFPETFEADEYGNRPFCTDCSFIKWGAWGTRVAFGDEEGSEYVDNVHLGWWVAGDITSAVDLETLADQQKYAIYRGNAIADVANRINRDDWATYVATGKLFMDWDFGHREGNFEISKFDKANFGGDGLTFGGPMTLPGRPGNHFAGDISGSLGEFGIAAGKARGSFVNDLNGNLARGVIGNWDVKNNYYKATGIFAGSGHPGPRPAN